MSAADRLTQMKNMLINTMTGKTQDAKSIPWNPDNTVFPKRGEVEIGPGQPEGACWVWGKDDYLGRLNLLTPSRVKDAASEIKIGQCVPLDLPSHIPTHPSWNRQPFEQKIKPLVDGVAYDDIYEMNTQSGTQWDGFRHVAHISTQTFYNGVKASEFVPQKEGERPREGENAHKCSVHLWREHGFTGRGILLDYKSWADSQGISFDTSTPHDISYNELVQVGKAQGIDIRPASQGGDIQPGCILFIRSGWVVDYYKRSDEENATLAARPEPVWAGVKQEEAMIDWLHDCYFAAVGGDAPAFEVYPTKQKWMLHEYLLALWGVPIGEMVDLERVSEIAKRERRYTFFVTSAPFRTVGGVASWLNATAIF